MTRTSAVLLVFVATFSWSYAPGVDGSKPTAVCKQTFVTNLYRVCSAVQQEKETDKKDWSVDEFFKRGNAEGSRNLNRFWRNVEGKENSQEDVMKRFWFTDPGFDKRELHRFWRGVPGDNGEIYSSSKTVSLEGMLTSCLVRMVKDTTSGLQISQIDPSTPIGANDMTSLREISLDELSAVSIMADYCCRHGCTDYLLNKLYSA